MTNNHRIVKYACYTANLSMSVVGTLSPLLFLTFRSLYGVSYSMLGALVLLNFCTQLLVDLLFSFYSHKFDTAKAVKLTPFLTVLGLLVYALFPFVFPNAVYVGLVLGTIIFAASGGLVEVLLSPVIAEIPAENPEREMSKLHSIYAWGVVAVVIISTVFLSVLGKQNWQWLALLFTLVPLVSCILFMQSDIPAMQTPEKAANVWQLVIKKEFLLCFFCIFLGGASECTMAQWSSSYLEGALGIPKVWGDVLGVAMFALMLGLGRTMYAKYGKHIHRVLFWGSAGAFVCYLTAALSQNAMLGLCAAALTGICVSMLWPGSLIVASGKFPASGVAIFALMAAGGDLGGSVGPQLVGLVTDTVLQGAWAAPLAKTLNLSLEQLGMRAGLFTATLFPLLAAILFAVLLNSKRKETAQETAQETASEPLQ